MYLGSTMRTVTPGRTKVGRLVRLLTVAALPFLAARDGALAEDTLASPERASATRLTPAEERLKADVTYLADDAREGRSPGSKGIEAAADYIADAFRGAGLKPAPGANGYFQHFPISGSPALKGDPSLELRGPDGKEFAGKLRTDFGPMAIGVSADLHDVPVVFVGYGITANDPSRKLEYDDYAGIDVKGKAVLLIRKEPRQKDAASPFDGTDASKYATFQHKATNAFQHEAAAVLFVNDAASLRGDEDRLLAFNGGGIDAYSRIPFVMLSRAFADKVLAAAGQPSLTTLENEIDQDLKPRSRELKGWKLTEDVKIDRHGIDTKNVIGVIEGAGAHAGETLVIGGHYDHLGRGGLTSGSLSMLSRDIHNGADDNASGTAMVLELARRLGARRDPPPRRIVFIAFSGEERGLIGSQYYVAHPLFPLASTVMMINCDMVGRMNARNELTMIGTGTTPGIDVLVDVLGKSAGLKIKKVAGMTDGFGGSDHQSFYAKDIPVLFAFTGIHSDYHRPSDDSGKINFSGMASIADYLELIALDIVRRPERTAYVRVDDKPRRPMAGSGSSSGKPMASLGIMPDYAHEAKDGLSLSGVRPDGGAEKAGLKEGDLIIKMGKQSISTIYDYMEVMDRYKPGDTVDVVVKRDGKEVKMSVTLGSRPRE